MIRRIAMALSFVLLFTGSAWAQLSSQTALVGTVTDSGGLVVPGAQVVAINTGTKDTYEATTNNEGYYDIPFARPGRYEITVSMAGFQTFKTTGVELNTNQVVRTNATLQVGAITESVTVESAAQVLNTDRATVSETINERAIVELPLQGRNVWSLAQTTPGVLSAGQSDIGQSFRGAGQREIQNSLALDGINSSANLLAATSMRPIAEAVTEIQVQTGSTSAEFGSFLGVHINVVTKSGTNSLHGSVFPLRAGRFARRPRLFRQSGPAQESADPKTVRSSSRRPNCHPWPLRWPQPDVLHGRLRRRSCRGSVQSHRISADSTDATRQFLGNYRRHPQSVHRTAVPRNIIPTNMLSSTALRILEYYPATNRAGTNNNYQGQGSSRTTSTRR